jgi:hypothetical protein
MGEEARPLDELVLVLNGALGSHLTGRAAVDRLAVVVENLVFLLHQLIGGVVLEALDGLGDGNAEDLAAMAGATGGIERVGDVGIGLRSSRSLDHVLLGRGIALKRIVVDHRELTGHALLMDVLGHVLAIHGVGAVIPTNASACIQSEAEAGASASRDWKPTYPWCRR